MSTSGMLRTPHSHFTSPVNRRSGARDRSEVCAAVVDGIVVACLSNRLASGLAELESLWLL